MTEHEAKRPEARPVRQRLVRLFGEKPQLTPEELAARNAERTAQKIREIFARKEPREIQN